MRLPLLRRRSDVLVVAVDAGAALLTAYVAFLLRFEGDPPIPDSFLRHYRIASVLLVVGWLLAVRVGGLSSRRALRPGTSNVEEAFAAAGVVGIVLSLVNSVALHGDLSRAWIGLVVFGLLLSGIGTRGVLRRSRRALVPFGLGLERYAVVGTGPQARRLHADLTRAPGAPFRIVAELPDDVAPADLIAQVLQLNLDGLVLPPGSDQLGASLSSLLSGRGIDVLLAPQFGDLEQRVASIAMLHGVPLLRVAGLAPRRRAIRVPPRDRARHGIAILGTRGVPANYGGFETFAERLALGLVNLQIDTTVYCRSHYVTEPSPWRGVRLVTLPTVRSKYFDTVVHTTLSALHLVLTRGPRDVILCNAANAPVLLLLRLCRRRVILNVDGLEWRRSKWGVAGRAWYRMGEWLSVRLAAVLVTDALEVQTYYRVRHDTDSAMIPYGADLLTRGEPAVPAQIPVTADGYVLYVSRWERENNPLMMAQAHAASGADLDLVMLGGATYDEQLERDVRAAASGRAHLPGALFGDAYRGLQANARCYVHATEVGGTHPALIEALGAGNVVLVLDTPENREVAGEAGIFFADATVLAELLRWVAGLGVSELDDLRERSRQQVRERYAWPVVTAEYVALIGQPAKR